MRQNSGISLNLTAFRNQPNPSLQYKSKLIADLMNSDSEDDCSPHKQFTYDYSQYLQGQPKQSKNSQKLDRKSVGKYNTSSVPPLTSINKVQSNRSRQSIKYQCLKVNGNKLIQNLEQDNTLNIDEASMIPIQNQQDDYSNSFSSQQQPFNPMFNHSKNCLKDKSNRNDQKAEISEESTTISRVGYRSKMSMKNHEKDSQSIIDQNNRQIKKLASEIALLREQMQMKDDFYEELNQKYMQKVKQNKNLQIAVNQANQDKKQLTDKMVILQNTLKEKQATIRKKEKACNQNQNPVYEEVSEYLKKIVEEAKNKLMQHKMSPFVEDIIQQFMTQLLNINKITVSRSKSRSGLFDSTPNKENLFYASNVSNNKFMRNSILTKTPQRECKIEKTEELQNLQKSLQKLRQMERNFTPTKNLSNKASVVSKYNTYLPQNSQMNQISNVQPYNTSNTMINQQYQSLDRSSLMFLDRSANRSKSRRKKIFNRENN